MQEESSPQQYASTFVTYLLENDLLEHVSYSDRSKGFRIDTNSLSLPPNISLAERKSCRNMSTTLIFDKKKRVRFLDKKLLDDNLTQLLLKSLESYDVWLQSYIFDNRDNFAQYANEFTDEFDEIEETLSTHGDEGVDPDPLYVEEGINI